MKSLSWQKFFLFPLLSLILGLAFSSQLNASASASAATSTVDEEEREERPVLISNLTQLQATTIPAVFYSGGESEYRKAAAVVKGQDVGFIIYGSLAPMAAFEAAGEGESISDAEAETGRRDTFVLAKFRNVARMPVNAPALVAPGLANLAPLYLRILDHLKSIGVERPAPRVKFLNHGKDGNIRDEEFRVKFEKDKLAKFMTLFQVLDASGSPVPDYFTQIEDGLHVRASDISRSLRSGSDSSLGSNPFFKWGLSDLE